METNETVSNVEQPPPTEAGEVSTTTTTTGEPSTMSSTDTSPLPSNAEQQPTCINMELPVANYEPSPMSPNETSAMLSNGEQPPTDYVTEQPPTDTIKEQQPTDSVTEQPTTDPLTTEQPPSNDGEISPPTMEDTTPDQQVPVADSKPDAETDDGDHGTFHMKSHTFCVPKKEIAPSPDEIPRWEKSEAYKDLMGFIHAMNDAVKGKKISDPYPMSQMLVNLVALLDKMDSWIDEFPPIDQPQRFGNTAFRDWFQKLKENGVDLVREATEEQYHPACEEMATYLIESVGNQTRIDYGTGHELAFAAFLLCLYKIGALTEADAPGLILRVFERYLKLVRRLQQTYRMEPAGSQGVWSLDDHHFLPFIWGSAQLLGHRRIFPKSIPKPEIFEHFSKDYMFLGCIKYIDQVKTGPFAEHSNQLWNISGVPHWEKVNSGLFKMYKAEVLAKFPVIQHFLFGSLLSIQPAT